MRTCIRPEVRQGRNLGIHSVVDGTAVISTAANADVMVVIVIVAKIMGKSRREE